ncbi:protein FAM227A-like isoform X2 [Rhopilema esculentum]
MDQLNDKIATLSVCLDDFDQSNVMPQLVADNQIGDPFLVNNSADGDGDFDEISGFGYMKENESLKKKSKQALNSKELDQFAGMYSIKMVLSQSLHNTSHHSSLKSFRKRMQSKIGMSESSHSLNKKPMLVELHSFPGYDSDEITPLPSPITALDILKIVTAAQLDLERKPTFKREFTKFFYSRLSQAILCDTFWWYFCEKYQQTPESQEKLFNRVAHNYTKLLIRWIGSKYQGTIFNRYPDILAQSVYATFCQAFPTSYRQFDDKFKDDLIFLVQQWITGTRPAPRAFEKWNFEGLEPSDIRKGDKHHIDSSKKSKRSDLELDLNEDTLGLLRLSDSKQKAATSSQISGQTRSRRISRAAPLPASKRGNLLLPSIQEPGDKEDVTVSHSAIKILQHSDAENEPDRATVSVMPAVRLMPTMKTKRESCKAGKGPSFSKNVFDIHGRSPLIEQFLMSNNLSNDAGVGVLVRRTEIARLPSQSALTYEDIIKESRTFASKLEKKYRSMIEENAAERAKTLKKQKELQRRLSRRTAELMASPNEVKRISNLLRLHLLRDQNDDYDSWSADIKAELSKALGYDVIE